MRNFKDALIEKAYKDYLYTRDMMNPDKGAGIEDLATVSLRFLKQHGKLDKVGSAGAGGTYSVKINVNVNGENEPWLLTFRNSAVSGGPSEAGRKAAFCLENCVKDALSERAHAYAAVRLSGAGDPLVKTLGFEAEGGEVSPKKAANESVKGFSSYVERLGIATGLADEVYHPELEASRFESVALVSAVPAVNMRKEEVLDEDAMLMLEEKDVSGDGSSATYIRKIQSLLRNGDAARMVKSCKVAKRGIVCIVGQEFFEMFSEIADDEGLRCSLIDKESMPDDGLEEGRAGTEDIFSEAAGEWRRPYVDGETLGFAAALRQTAEDINMCSRRGLSQRFDSTIGTSCVMMPIGGVNQLTPVQAAAYKIPIEKGNTDDCSVMSWAINPHIYKESPYHGAYLAVVESVAKLVAAGAAFNEVYLSVASGSGGGDGRSMAALLGAFEAEMGLSVPAVSADTMSDSDAFISYAITMGKASELISPEFKQAGHKVVMLEPEIEKDKESVYYGLPTPHSLNSVWRKAYELIANGRAVAAYTPGMGGIAEAVMKMSYGNGIGFEFADDSWSEEPVLTNEKIFGYSYGSIILEMRTDDPIRSRSVKITDIGKTTDRQDIRKGTEAISIGELLMLHEGKLESVYPANSDGALPEVADVNYAARSWHAPIFKRAVPKVLIPALPGATSAADVAGAVRSAGGQPEILYLPSGSAEAILRSAEKFAKAIENTQIVFLPDGYAGSIDDAGGGVELDLAELTSYIFRNEQVRENITRFLDRKDGLIAGIGSGFKALLNLGLLPGGVISDEDGPLLIENALGTHQSRIVRIRVSSNKSPWLRSCRPGEILSLPLSCAEGRFTASDEVLKKLAVNGQIATQYADDNGKASSDIRFNPAGSMMAIEGITSPDGRVLGRMGHAERAADGLYRNVPGTYFTSMFENAVKYFR